MRPRRGNQYKLRARQLDDSLMRTLDRARRLESRRVVEAVLCAIEARAAETGETAAVDAAYLSCLVRRTWC